MGRIVQVSVLGNLNFTHVYFSKFCQCSGADPTQVNNCRQFTNYNRNMFHFFFAVLFFFHVTEPDKEKMSGVQCILLSLPGAVTDFNNRAHFSTFTSALNGKIVIFFFLSFSCFSCFLSLESKRTVLKEINPLCFRNAFSLCSDHNFHTSWYLWRWEFCCAVTYMWQIRASCTARHF